MRSRRINQQNCESSARLSTELEKLGLTDLAQRARNNVYHDFKSDLATPKMQLVADLASAIEQTEKFADREAIRELRKQVINGDFDD